MPPSPASVCSSVHEELFRPSDVSPASTPDVPFVEDYPVPHLFREISSNLSGKMVLVFSNGFEVNTVSMWMHDIVNVEYAWMWLYVCLNKIA